MTYAIPGIPSSRFTNHQGAKEGPGPSLWMGPTWKAINHLAADPKERPWLFS